VVAPARALPAAAAPSPPPTLMSFFLLWCMFQWR
jgi:hypothetical protein